MGYGDKLMAIGDALHPHSLTGRKVAIGDGVRVDRCALDHGHAFLADQAWVDSGAPFDWSISASSMRPYIDYQKMRSELIRMNCPKAGVVKTKKLVGLLGRYIWNTDYRAKPAAFVWRDTEQEIIERISRESVIIVEPHIKARAPVNKQWPVDYMQAVVDHLSKSHRIIQVSTPGTPTLRNASRAEARDFREAAAHLAGAKLYIGPEGGLHHASAAAGTPAVVMFGGFISPKITGYETHVNLTGGAAYFCGTKSQACPHCTQLMRSIEPDQVIEASRKFVDVR